MSNEYTADKKAADLTVESTSSPPPQKLTTGGKIKRHYKRFWWVHLIIFLAGVLLISLLLVYVAFPRIAQHDVSESTLDITSMKITNPRADGFELEVTNVIGSKSRYHPRLDAFNASMYLDDSETPFSTIRIPSINVHDGLTFTFSQNITITNMTAFDEFSVAFVQRENFTLKVKGRTGLHEMKFPTTHVDYVKKVNLKGLNGFSGLTVSDINVLLTPLADGTNMNGTTFIPNPSVFSLELGNLTLDIATPISQDSNQTTALGTSAIENVVLTPGGITVPLTSITDQTLVLGLIQNNTDYQASGLIPVQITGNTSVYDDVTIPYFTHALGETTTDVELDVESALDKLGLGGLFGSSSTSSTASAATATATA